MQRFTEGDRVRVDIPDETDIDYERLHGQRGEVVEIIKDDASDLTGDERDDVLYRVRFNDDETADLRWRDLRPP